MAGLIIALIVIAAFGLALWMLEGEDWARMRHGHLPRPTIGSFGPRMRDVLHLRADHRERPAPEPVAAEPLSRAEALQGPKVSIPPATPAQPQVAPDPPKPRERSVEASVYDRLYGDRRMVRKEEPDD